MGNKMLDFRKDYDWSKVEQPFTDDQVKIWTAALRSGDYAQASGQMEVREEDKAPRQKAGFCCLGVANKVLDLGVSSCQATIARPDLVGQVYIGMPQIIQVELYTLNDSRGKTFAEIADFIEEGFGLV